MLLRAMVGDITRHEMEQGQRSASSRYALFNITLRLAMGFGVAAALGSLGWAGFTPGEPASDEALLAVRAAYALPATIAALAACALLLPRAEEEEGGQYSKGTVSVEVLLRE